jgi:hypothetical protein
MSDIHRTIEAVWKIESTRLIAGIARVTRDIGIDFRIQQFRQVLLPPPVPRGFRQRLQRQHTPVEPVTRVQPPRKMLG